MSNTPDFRRQRDASYRPDRPPQDKPAWGEGIRAIYDAVTQESLPADFHALLNKLGKPPKDIH